MAPALQPILKIDFYPIGRDFVPLRKDSIDVVDTKRIGEEYVRFAVVINKAGEIHIAADEAEARRLAEVAHASEGWSWGVLYQKRAVRSSNEKLESNGVDTAGAIDRS